MPIVRRIYVSLPADPWLPKNLNDLITTIQGWRCLTYLSFAYGRALPRSR
jgi:hypothetical protein